MTLFVRGKRRLTLTEEGSFLLQRAAQLLDLEDKTRQELTTMKDGISGTLCLGMVEGRTPYLCARWIAGFREEFPRVRYSQKVTQLPQFHLPHLLRFIISKRYDKHNAKCILFFIKVVL